MANVLSGNSFYVTVASTADSTSHVASKDVQLVGIIFNSATAGHQLVLNDLNQQSADATATAGALKLDIKNSATNQTVFQDMASCPMRFPNGIWVSTCSSGAVATLILKLKS